MSEKVTIKVERKTLHLPTIALRGLVVFPNNLDRKSTRLNSSH